MSDFDGRGTLGVLLFGNVTKSKETFRTNEKSRQCLNEKSLSGDRDKGSGTAAGESALDFDSGKVPTPAKYPPVLSITASPVEEEADVVTILSLAVLSSSMAAAMHQSKSY